MNVNTRIDLLFNIKYPIIQAGMVWVWGWKLASAVSNCGGLGLIMEILPVKDLFNKLIAEFIEAREKICG